MSLITVCKANPLGNYEFQDIKDQVIAISGKIPRHMSLPECEKFHERQATMISDALFESLPQGTLDRLGIMFMQKKVSLYQGRIE